MAMKDSCLTTGMWIAFSFLLANAHYHQQCNQGKQVIHVNRTTCFNDSNTIQCSLGQFFRQVNASCPEVEIILQPDLNYTLTDNSSECSVFNYTNMRNFTLTSSGGSEEKATIVCDHSDDMRNSTPSGLFLQGSQSVTLNSVGFKYCSFPIKNYTMECINTTETETDWTGIYIEYTNRVTLVNVEVSNTNGVALMLYSINRVMINKSTFRANGLRGSIEFDSSGAVFIEVPNDNSQRCKPSEVTFNIATESLAYTVIDSTFADNFANPKECLPWKNISRKLENDPDDFIYGRGSGIQIYLRDTASNAHVVIENCTFENNTAVFGAGFSTYLQGKASNNYISVVDCKFLDNNGIEYNDNDWIESGGGGMQVMITNFPFDFKTNNMMHNNTVNVTNCTFEHNSAYFGGAVSIITAQENTSNAVGPTNRIVLENCRWFRNRARLGSAVDCVSWKDTQNRILPHVDLRGNKFWKNTVIYDKNEVAAIGGTGTIYTDSITLNLKDENNFVDNQGSGIIIVNAIVHFSTNSINNFVGNHAIKGGGLCIYGHGRMILHPNTSLLFEGNSAFLNGAAIYYRLSGPRNLLTSQSCFIQFHNSRIGPDKWKENGVRLEFKCNKANMDGSTIYASSILPCVWTGVPYGDGFMMNWTSALQKIRLYLNFTSDPCNSTIINTDTLWANTSALKSITAIPGQKLRLSDTLRNEFGDASYSVFRGDSENPEKGNVSDSKYISQMQFRLAGHPRDHFKIKLSSPWTLSYIIRSNVTLMPCAPGFDISEKNKQCECTASKRESYEGILRCESDRAILHDSYWAGYVTRNTGKLCTDEEIKTNNSCILYTGYCVYNYCNNIFSGHLFSAVKLPATASNDEINELICDSQNRAGVLCSKCKEGHGLELNSFHPQCVPCKPNPTGDYVLAVIIWLCARLVPLTIMVVVFLLFDIDVLTGSMQCFIFYSQMLSFITSLIKDRISFREPFHVMTQLSYMGYDIWKLRFGRYLYEETRYGAPSLCVHVNYLTLKSLEYVPAIFPFIIIYTLWLFKGIQERGYCCRPFNALLRRIRVGIHRLRRQWSPNSTIIHGLVAFVVLSYTKFLLTSSILIMPTFLTGRRGEGVLYRVKYNASLSYTDLEYYSYFIPAVFVLMTFIALPPIILILVPLVPRRLVKWDPERKHKLVWLCDKLFSGAKWQFFLDAFQGGFKPHFSFFSGLFFLYRIVIITTHILPINPTNRYVFLMAEILVFLVIHALCQPYRRRIHNIMDTLIYANMLIVLLMGNYAWHKSSQGNEKTAWNTLYIIIVTMNIPQVCFVIYLAYCIFKTVRKACIAWRLRRNGVRSIRRSSEERDLELLNDSFQCRNDYSNFDELEKRLSNQ